MAVDITELRNIQKKLEQGSEEKRIKIEQTDEVTAYLEHQLTLLPERFASGAHSLREAENLADWETAISNLTKKQKRFVELYYFDGDSRELVQKKMKLTDNSFYLYKSRSLKRIKEARGTVGMTLYVVKHQEEQIERDYWLLVTVNGKWEIIEKTF